MPLPDLSLPDVGLPPPLPGLGTHLEGSFANSVDGLNSCGSGTSIIFAVLLLSLALNVFQIYNGRKIISMVLNALLNNKEVGDDKAAG